MNERVLRRPKFSDQIYEEIPNRSVKGALAENAKLPSEKDLGEQFGVSRPTVREALERLQLVQAEHAAVYQAIRDGDARGAREAMRRHIENARQRMFGERE